MSKSEAVTKLWQDADFRQKQKEAHELYHEAERATWPRVSCQHCNTEFAVRPCRVRVTKFCNRKCQSAYRTGRPNFKNRGRVPSRRAGSGISGTYKGRLFRSLYELSFIVNVLEAQAIDAEYETLRITLDDGTSYVPDFVSHQTKTIYEIKYAKALTQPRVALKLEAGRRYAETLGYAFKIYTEHQMRVLTLSEVVAMDSVVLHHKKNRGVVFQRLIRQRIKASDLAFNQKSHMRYAMSKLDMKQTIEVHGVHVNDLECYAKVLARVQELIRSNKINNEWVFHVDPDGKHPNMYLIYEGQRNLPLDHVSMLRDALRPLKGSQETINLLQQNEGHCVYVHVER